VKETIMQDVIPVPDPSARPAVSDTVRIQILATEHWSLLATRSMTWSELFSRATMFITVLSASVVALALVAQATDFSGTFRTFALLVLPVTLLLGIGTYIRLGDAMAEDVWLVMGMNRLRHGYLDLAPDLEPYFMTGHHDDFGGIMQTRGPRPQMGPSRMLSATPTLVSVINSTLVGVIAALLVGIVNDQPVMTTGVGLVAAITAGVILAGLIPRREINRFRQSLVPRFPGETPATTA
jgi:hypothetical protein